MCEPDMASVSDPAAAAEQVEKIGRQVEYVEVDGNGYQDGVTFGDA